MRERETETETERQRQTERETHRERERETELLYAWLDDWMRSYFVIVSNTIYRIYQFLVYFMLYCAV